MDHAHRFGTGTKEGLGGRADIARGLRILNIFRPKRLQDSDFLVCYDAPQSNNSTILSLRRCRRVS